MSRRSPLVIPLAVLFLLTCLPVAALAGVDPVPWHVIIENRTNQIDSASPLYNQSPGELPSDL